MLSHDLSLLLETTHVKSTFSLCSGLFQVPLCISYASYNKSYSLIMQYHATNFFIVPLAYDYQVVIISPSCNCITVHDTAIDWVLFIPNIIPMLTEMRRAFDTTQVHKETPNSSLEKNHPGSHCTTLLITVITSQGAAYFYKQGLIWSGNLTWGHVRTTLTVAKPEKHFVYLQLLGKGPTHFGWH